MNDFSTLLKNLEAKEVKETEVIALRKRVDSLEATVALLKLQISEMLKANTTKH